MAKTVVVVGTQWGVEGNGPQYPLAALNNP